MSNQTIIATMRDKWLERATALDYPKKGKKRADACLDFCVGFCNGLDAAGLPCPSGMVFIISVQGPGALEGYTHTEG